MHLVSKGVITNRKKGLNDGKLVASAAIGNSEFYEFLHDNPAIDFQPSDYVNDSGIISRHKRMVSMHVAMAMGGKGLCLMTGTVADVRAGVQAAVEEARQRGLLVSEIVIPRPSRELFFDYL